MLMMLLERPAPLLKKATKVKFPASYLQRSLIKMPRPLTQCLFKMPRPLSENDTKLKCPAPLLKLFLLKCPAS